MLEITNKNKSPVQLLIRSRKKPRTLTMLTIPGIGAGMNIREIEDERSTKYVEQAEKEGLIKIRKFNKKHELKKGE